jgi:hypothetical protein
LPCSLRNYDVETSFHLIRRELPFNRLFCQVIMSIYSNLVKKETVPILVIIGGALGLAGVHMTKLATDPHTPYTKNHDNRRWEQQTPARYMTVRWKDVMKKQERQ